MNRNRWRYLSVYGDLICRWKSKALVCVGLATIHGLFEGSAVLSLMPILQNAMQRSGASASVGNPIADFCQKMGGGAVGGLVVFFVLATFTAVLHYLSEARLIAVRAAVEADCRITVATACSNVYWPAYHGFRQGDIAQSMLAEAREIAVGVQTFLAMIGAVVITAVFFLTAIFVSARITIFAVVIGILCIFIIRIASKNSKMLNVELASITRNVGEQSDEFFQNIKFLRAAGLDRAMFQMLTNTIDRASFATFRALLQGWRSRLIAELVAVLLIGSLLSVMLVFGRTSASVAMVLLFLFYRLTPRLLSVVDYFNNTRIAIPYYIAWKEKIDFCETATSVPDGGSERVREFDLTFDGVTFTYPGGKEPVLSEISLKVGEGECVAIVGDSGQGKSTLLDLITGVVTPAAGRILVGQKPLSLLDIGWWRNRIGVVLQDSPIFHATVAQNIALGDSAIDWEGVRNSAKSANAEGFIGELRDGYETIVGEKGGRLSGGQRQRLALARALYRQPRLLLLDEATSALDGNAEMEIQRALNGIKGKCSILMVAHRLKTLEMADRILVLKNGRIVEQGTWSDLLQRDGGEFRAMAAAQGIYPEG